MYPSVAAPNPTHCLAHSGELLNGCIPLYEAKEYGPRAATRPLSNVGCRLCVDVQFVTRAPETDLKSLDLARRLSAIARTDCDACLQSRFIASLEGHRIPGSPVSNRAVQLIEQVFAELFGFWNDDLAASTVNSDAWQERDFLVGGPGQGLLVFTVEGETCGNTPQV